MPPAPTVHAAATLVFWTSLMFTVLWCTRWTVTTWLATPEDHPTYQEETRATLTRYARHAALSGLLSAAATSPDPRTPPRGQPPYVTDRGTPE